MSRAVGRRRALIRVGALVALAVLGADAPAAAGDARDERGELATQLGAVVRDSEPISLAQTQRRRDAGMPGATPEEGRPLRDSIREATPEERRRIRERLRDATPEERRRIREQLRDATPAERRELRERLMQEATWDERRGMRTLPRGVKRDALRERWQAATPMERRELREPRVVEDRASHERARG